MSRPLRWILLGLGIALLVALAVVVAQRRTIARSLLEAELRALGVSAVEIQVEHVGLAELRVRKLRIGREGDLAVDAIDARYSLPGLAAGRLDALSLRGVRLRASLHDDGLSFGTLDPLLRENGAPTSTPAPARAHALPATVVSIEDVAVELATPRGDLTLELSGRAQEVAEGRVEVETRISGRGALDPGVGAGAEPVALDWVLDASGELSFTGTALEFDLAAVTPDAPIELRASGAHDLATGRGEARLELRPLEFQPGVLQPRFLFPIVGQPFEVTGGSLQAKGESRWGGEQPPSGSLDVTLRELSVASEQGRFERLNAAIHLDGPWPASTPPTQRVTVGRVDFGLELTDGRLSFQLRPDGVVDIDTAECTFAGGSVRTRGSFDASAAAQKLVLEFTDIELAALLALVDMDGLTGSGKLAGRIPLVRRGETLEIHQGRLEATEAGWVRYASRVGAAGMGDQDQGFGMALAVLENFHFETLVATLDGDTSGSIPVAIRLAGANPDYAEGHPVDFTLTVDSRLADLLRDAGAAYRIPAEIERSVLRGLEKR